MATHPLPATAPPAPGAFAPEARGAFGGFIGPKNLLALVENGAPFLFDGSHPLAHAVPETSGARLDEHGRHALGWWSILRHAELVPATPAPTPAERSDYFALCLAAHFASVASYVPTDVDAKIRHALWFEDDGADELARRRDLALALVEWDIRPVSTRWVEVEGFGVVSGHDGERLSVLCGGLLGMLARGDTASAQQFETAIEHELDREARAFLAVAARPGRELELLGLATILTHNAGDVMQAFNSKGAARLGPAQRLRFGELARERFERYGGAFGQAAALYRTLLASEGHRNYPLRELKLLRASPALLLPLGPFLDDWGQRLARHPGWSAAQRAGVIGGVIEGCRRVAGQEGYYRALAGFEQSFPGGLEARELAGHYGSAVKKLLKDSELRKRLAVRRESFESSYRKRARALLPRGSA